MYCNRFAISTGFALLFSATLSCADDHEQEYRQRIGPGNPVAGRLKSVLCHACHASTGKQTVQNAPKLAGQYASYLLKQLKDYRAGKRNDPAMSRIAMTLAEDDLDDIAAYFASRRMMRGSEMLIYRVGEARYMDISRGCATCHGENGKGLGTGNSSAPVIGGQNKDYLVEELEDFRDGLRTNDTTGIMSLVASMMSDEEIDQVATFLSGQ